MASNPRTADDACSYFRSEEQRCQSDDRGQMHCELLKRVWRQCPGQPAEEVETERTVTTPSEHGDARQPIPEHEPWGFGRQQLTLPSQFGGLGDMFAQLEAMLHGPMLGSMQPERRLHGPAPPAQRAAPPSVRVDEV